MSHFTVAVILPREASDNHEREVGTLLAPYNENDEVEPYPTECYCASDRYREHDPERPSPDPECRECSGTGTEMSTYNPKSKWDYWDIGGRWSGNWDGENIRTVRDIPADKVPFAIVTPDGEWHERGRMAWFAVVHDEREQHEWESIRNAIFAECLDHTAVLVDCHI